MKRLVALLTTSAVLGLSVACQATAQTYDVTDLGTLGGTSSSAWDLNNSAQIVGDSMTAGNQSGHAFLWAAGSMTDLGTLPDGNGSVAYGINGLGQVVGADATATWFVRLRAFLYRNGTMENLGSLGAGDSQAVDVNDQTQVVGSSGLVWDNSTVHAFLWQNGVMTDLGTLPGGSHSSAVAINNLGYIAGYSRTSGGVSHVTLWNPSGSITDLGTLGGNLGGASDINEFGQVVGMSEPCPGCNQHAFLWENGVMHDLGSLAGPIGSSRANAINGSGQIVGASTLSPQGLAAFLWDGGTMIDLNDRIPNSSGWVLESAESINDAGEIVGEGIVNGQTHAFLLTPMTPDACGDGVVTGAERCDDGVENGTIESCCSATCRLEPPGTGCEDGDACTRADQCSEQGACIGANPVICATSDQCHDAGTCDPETGICSNPAKTNGTTCNDGNACTQTDTCQNGACSGSNPVICAALDQCHDAGTCSPSTGLCSNPSRQDGTACSDGEPCTLDDTCQAGSCQAGGPTLLNPLANPNQTLECIGGLVRG